MVCFVDKLQGNLNPLPSQININGTSDVPPGTATGDDGVSVGQCNTGDDMADDEDPESKRRSFNPLMFLFFLFSTSYSCDDQMLKGNYVAGKWRRQHWMHQHSINLIVNHVWWFRL